MVDSQNSIRVLPPIDVRNGRNRREKLTCKDIKPIIGPYAIYAGVENSGKDYTNSTRPTFTGVG